MDIVEELRQNRESGAKRLEAEYKAGLMTLARRFCSDESDAAELVNRTFAAVVEGIDDYLEQSAFFAWMCQILTNIHSADVRRKSNRTVVYPGEVPDAPDEEADEDIYRHLDHALLRDAIQSLPLEMKEVIVMHYLLDEPVPKVAKFLCQPVTTVKWRLHCARKALAAKLGAAAKKPGGKALLIALALAALAAVGAAVVTAVGDARNTPPALSEGTPLSEGGDHAQDSSPLREGAVAEGDWGSTATGILQPAATNSSTPPLTNSSIPLLSPTTGENMSTTTIRKVALGAATALALAAAPPAATANSSQSLGTPAWDGQSWVYDTSQHVAAQHADGASPATTLATSPRGVGASEEISLDTVFMTRQWSNATSISGGSPAFIFMVR